MDVVVERDVVVAGVETVAGAEFETVDLAFEVVFVFVFAFEEEDFTACEDVGAVASLDVAASLCENVSVETACASAGLNIISILVPVLSKIFKVTKSPNSFFSMRTILSSKISVVFTEFGTKKINTREFGVTNKHRCFTETS